MRVPRWTGLATLIVCVPIIPGIAALVSRAGDKPALAAEPGGVSTEVILNQRWERVQSLENQLEEMRDEIARQHELFSIDRTDAQVAQMKLMGSYEEAKLARELAEIALKEYTDGRFLQQSAVLQTEINLAQDQLARAKARAGVSGRVADRLEVERADDALDQAKGKLDVLNKLDNVKKLGELRSDVEKATRDELTIMTQITLERARLVLKQQHVKKYGEIAPEGQVLSLWTSAAGKVKRAPGLLAEAQGLADQAKTDLEAAKGAGKLRKEAQTSLGDAVEIAKHVVATWTRMRDLEEELKDARASLVSNQPVLMPRDKDARAAKPNGAPIEVMLQARRDRMRELEEKLRVTRDEFKRQHGDIRLNVQARASAARATHEKSKLPRQLAELRAREYSEIVCPHDLELAQADIKKAEEALVSAKKHAKGSDLVRDRLEVEHAESVLDMVKTKRDVLVKYEQKMKMSELGAEVERAKSVELGTRATAGFERAEEQHVRELVARVRTSDQEALVVALLNFAIDQANQLEALVVEARKLADQATTDPNEARKLGEKIAAKITSARNMVTQAQEALTEAVAIARRVSADWRTLLDIEEELKKAQESVASLEKLAAKK